uniref:Uncharacterized protein n=1 Tax=Phlebotomus papatasi TaxID=29031 RepID=A0A1B0DJL7_PHLPP
MPLLQTEAPTSTESVVQKWTQRHADLKIGDVVLFLDDGAAATYWPLGVIEDEHPGRDDVVRVATVLR